MPNNLKIIGNKSVALIYGARFRAIKGIHNIFVDVWQKNLKGVLM
jgi:hypothetical protein